MSILPRVRAPREHGSLLAEPPLSQAGALLDHNHSRLAAARVDFLGKPFHELRLLARHETLAEALSYHHDAGEPAPALTGNRWLVAGHQPELFHPGVWVKNFALNRLAQRLGSTPLNLVVDNDTAKTALLRVPHEHHLARVPFDHSTGEVPYEERTVHDEGLFASLPERVVPLTAAWPFRPMLPDFWAEARNHAGRTPLLGERLAAARRHFERAWGCHSWEVPLSRLCQTEAFAWFAGHLLDHLPRLHAVYNEAVHDYRHRYGLKSKHHPVPDLARDGDWLEAPLWASRTGQPRRGRLFVRRTGNRLELRADQAAWPTLELAAARPQSFIDAWRHLEPAGYKVRTRALTTTLFSRLLLGDLFLHGIGGGKYDELTDALFARFLGITAPSYMVLSATLLLPLPHFDTTADECRRLDRQRRDLVYNPQRHLPLGVATDLVRERYAWVERSCATHAERVERFRELRRLNDALHPFVNGQQVNLQVAIAACRRHVEVNAVNGRRDYAFCLYPEAMLREYFGQLPI